MYNNIYDILPKILRTNLVGIVESFPHRIKVWWKYKLSQMILWWILSDMEVHVV